MRHIKTRYTAICAVCDQPAVKHGFEPHPELKGWFLTASYGPADYDQVFCYRMPDDIGFASWLDRYGVEQSDYWRIDDNDVALVPDVSGPESLIIPMMLRSGEDGPHTFLDEHDYEFPTREWEKVDRWTDGTHKQYQRQYDYDKAKREPLKEHVEEWVSTLTLQQHQALLHGHVAKRHIKEVLLSKVTRNDEVVETEFGPQKQSRTVLSAVPYDTRNEVETDDRNVYVENNPGFLSIQVLNEELTKKYHNRLLNVYVDRNTGQMRVGGVRLVKNVDGTIQGVCVNDSCKGRSAALNPHTASREDMEQFVWALISHGNNHAAKFIREREDFYPLHHPGCDLSEDLSKSRGVCTYRGPSPKVVTEEEEVQFLMEHQRFCKDSKCQCEDRLAEMVPALAHA